MSCLFHVHISFEKVIWDYVCQFRSDVSKGSRTGSSSITLTVIDGNPPAVSVLRPNIKVTASEKVRLQGMYNSSIEPIKVEWICAQHEGKYFLKGKLSFF